IAAKYFPPIEQAIITSATIMVSQLLKKTEKSIIIPTLIKKNGMNMALPTNSIRFINDEVCGINLFNANPARNAPIMASTPANSAKSDAKYIMTKTKIYCEILSSTFLKNQRPMIGKISKTTNPKTTTDPPNFNQNSCPTSPCDMPTTAAKTNNAKISVIMVPPTVTLTDLFLV